MRTSFTIIKILAALSLVVYLLHGETFPSISNLVHDTKNTEIEGHTFFMNYDVQSVRNYYGNKINTKRDVTEERISLLLIVHFPSPSSFQVLSVENIMGEMIGESEMSTAFCKDRYMFLLNINSSVLNVPLHIANYDEWDKREWYPANPWNWKPIAENNGVLEIQLSKNGMYDFIVREMSPTEITMMALDELGKYVKVEK